jgi:hypothetical protein
MKNFNKAYIQLLEDMTSGAVFGPGQAHETLPGKSGDFYASGDARNIWGGVAKKKNKKKKYDGKAVPLIRRSFPKGL